MKRIISSDDYYAEIEEEEPVAEIQAQQGVELKLANGNVIKAATYEEALKVAVKMTEDTQAALKTEREQWNAKQTELETRVNELATQIPKPVPTNGNGFDNQRYWTLLNSDPVAAQNYVDAHRFGISDPAQVPAHFQRMDERINNFDQQMLASQFIYQHEEFPATPENAAILTKEVEELVKAGHPASIETLNMAWGAVVETGKIKPLEVKEQAVEEANPSLTGGGGPELLPDDKFEKMSTAEMEAYLKSQGRI